MIDRLSHPRSFFFLDVLIGVLACAVGAVVLALIFRGSSLRSVVPLLFIFVIVLAALRFGMLASTIGAFAATLIFAYFLFSPVGSLHVEKSESRTNLVWMLLIGVPVGYFAWATKADSAKR